LDDASRQKVNDWINARCKTLNCPACGHREWACGELGVMIPLENSAVQLSGGMATPAVPIVCQHCGFIYLFEEQHPGEPPPQPEFVWSKSLYQARKAAEEFSEETHADY
jgi:hypothetical protein